jgi:hypothetical protein
MATESTYKGNPVISLNPESKYPFSFGLTKARLILDNLDDIKAFTTRHSHNGHDTPTITSGV